VTGHSRDPRHSSMQKLRPNSLSPSCSSLSTAPASSSPFSERPASDVGEREKNPLLLARSYSSSSSEWTNRPFTCRKGEHWMEAPRVADRGGRTRNGREPKYSAGGGGAKGEERGKRASAYSNGLTPLQTATKGGEKQGEREHGYPALCHPLLPPPLSAFLFWSVGLSNKFGREHLARSLARRTRIGTTSVSALAPTHSTTFRGCPPSTASSPHFFASFPRAQLQKEEKEKKREKFPFSPRRQMGLSPFFSLFLHRCLLAKFGAVSFSRAEKFSSRNAGGKRG
jgi:hypothetical protein